MARSKKKKNIKVLGKKELIFNVVSLLVIIAIGVYFGGRSFYYFGLQNKNSNSEVKIFNESIIDNNKLVKDTAGFHQDGDGYYFKGNVTNNYVKFSNRIFRIIRLNNDGSVKVVSDNNVGSFYFGDESNYEKSNLNYFLDKSVDNTGIYYDTISNVDKFLVKTKYSEDTLKNNKIINNKKSYEGYITTISLSDYINSGSKNSFINNGKMFYLLGLDDEDSNLFVENDGTINSTDSLSGYGVRAVFTLKSDLELVSGVGTIEDPYVINMGNDTNKVGSYVRLGNDLYRVNYSKDGILKMYLVNYINNNGVEAILSYSNKGSTYNLNNKKSLAYILNSSYLYGLSYNEYLLDNNFYTGEVSSDTSYDYRNIYSNYVTCKVGLLNLFDYVEGNDTYNYFRMNTLSNLSNSQYSVNEYGAVEEVDVTEVKHIITVVSINESIIKNGEGSIDNPYVVE